jgi:hypothetical protein
MREWMGTKEGTSLGTHVREVVAQYTAARPHHQVHVSQGIRLETTFRWMLVLHDIGKPAAVEAGSRDLQHAFTAPVLLELSKRVGFRDEEIALMRALVDNNAIGDVLRPGVHRDVNGAARELSALAKEVGMSAADYFALQSLFFIADAGSYRHLRELIFITDSAGALRLKDPKFEELRALVA